MSGELLRTGQVVLTVNSRQPCVVMKFLGGGGQGEVYAVELSGKPMAVKWYFPYTATKEQWESLRRLVTNGPPGGSEKFLWPIELVHAENVNGFGYLMPLRAQRYKGIQDMMSGRQDASFQVLTTAGFQLVESFRILHGQGLCYRDISFGNAFFDPITGDVLVCDNDNVGPNRTKSTIMGTPHFMAPELVRGEANPDRQTDLHSLAVLLFYMFHIHNPLYGKRMLNIRCLDASAITMLCGMEPLFIA
jgi:serine/threonine protein kinase